MYSCREQVCDGRHDQDVGSGGYERLVDKAKVGRVALTGDRAIFDVAIVQHAVALVVGRNLRVRVQLHINTRLYIDALQRDVEEWQQRAAQRQG